MSVSYDASRYDYNVSILMCPDNPNISCIRGVDYTDLLIKFKPGLRLPILAKANEDTDMVTNIENDRVVVKDAIKIGEAVVNDIRRHSGTEHILILNMAIESKYDFSDNPTFELKVATLEKTFLKDDKRKKVVENLLYVYPVNIIKESKAFRDIGDLRVGPVGVDELNKNFLFNI